MEEQNLDPRSEEYISAEDFEKKFKNHAGIHSMQTIFGEIKERNVVFCIDTSGSMYTTINVVKEHLIEALLKHAFKEGKTKFNVLACNSKIQPLSDCLVDCTPKSVVMAGDWIRKMEIGSSIDILPAILASFQNKDVDSVFLVTDGHPCDKNREVLLSHLEYISRGRPLHCLYVTDKPIPERSTGRFLESIAQLTSASFRIASITTQGALQCVRPIYTSPQCQKPPLKPLMKKHGYHNPRISISAQLKGDPLMEPVFTNCSVVQDPLNQSVSPFFHPYNHWFWPGLPSMMHLAVNSQQTLTPFYGLSKHRPSRAFLQGRDHLAIYEDDQFLAPSAGAMIVGRKLLAQRNSDGLFYKVNVKSQLGPCGFLLEFPANTESNGRPIYQESSLQNTLSLEDAHRHPIVAGDYILAPRGEADAYHPAQVVSGSEMRDPIKSREDSNLEIKWHDDITEGALQSNQAVWISQQFHSRALQYLQNVKENRLPQQDDQQQDGKYLSNDSSAHSNCGTMANIEDRSKSAPCITGADYTAPYSQLPVFPKGSFYKDKDGIKSKLTREEIELKAAEEDFSPVKRWQHFDMASSDEEDEKEEASDDDDEAINRSNVGESRGLGARARGRKERSRQKTFITGEDTETEDEDVDEGINMTRSLTNFSSMRNIDRPMELPPRLSTLESPNQKRKVSPERPPWRYWMGEKIPNILDPPIFEPYEPPRDMSECIGGTQLYQGNVESSSPAFNLLKQGDITYNDPQRMYALFHHRTHEPTPFAQRDAAVGRDCIDPWLSERNRWERKTRYQHHGYPNSGTHNIPTQDNVSQLMNDNHEARIRAQFERDSLNRMNYQEKSEKKRNEALKKISEKYSSNKSQMADSTDCEDGWTKDPGMVALHAERARKQLCSGN